MQNQQDNRQQNKPVTEEQDRKALEGMAQMNKEQVAAAHEQADRDMEDDAEFTASSPNDDLDEGETARLGEGKNELI